MALEEYEKKRRFERTPEPKKEKTHAGKEFLHFVVHKHNASHLHYDLRLELNGVLKSWAVPKGPSMDPNDKRLAMMVEDHPFDYKDFEGVIPKGEYGGGEVIIWDSGAYSSSESPESKKSSQELNAGLAKGHLSFVLQGNKLKGTFDLVKIEDKNKNSKNNSWLLIKRPDDFVSKDDVLKQDQSVFSGKTINDLKIQSEMLHNVKPMLAVTRDEPFDEPGWVYEIKWDGYRAIAEVNSGEVFLYSRNNFSYNLQYPELINELKQMKARAVIDGEIVVLDENGLPDFGALQNYAEKKHAVLAYEVFDCLYLNGKDLRGLTLLERKNILKQILPPSSARIRYNDHISGNGIEFYNRVVETGLEGIVAKKSDSKYYEGKRTDNWVKIKESKYEDAIICGYTEPRGGRSHFGALILGKYRGDELVYIGHTGGGFDDKSLNSMWSTLHGLENDNCSFRTVPDTNEKPHWVSPELVCEVKFSNWTKDDRLRQPIFVRLREDLDPSEIRFADEINTYFKAEIKEREDKVIKGNKLTLTNLSKVYWPEDNYTKRDLVEYYSKIAPIILPYLKDRPESMLRHPNGINEGGFFQKNIEDAPKWAKTFKFRSETEEREINYLICNDEQTLIYMVNLGCIEINPWSSRMGSPNCPDFMIIDLDPEETGFENVVKTAQVTKEILDELKIPAYCKTSGKTGLHICIPTDAKYDFEQVRNFCEILVRLIHKKIPEITSVERMPGKRKGRVYLDFLQNRIGQTITAPYSVRPVKKATVSTPILWDELNKIDDPSAFNIRNTIKRLGDIGDVWGPVLGKGVEIEKVLDMIIFEK